MEHIQSVSLSLEIHPESGSFSIHPTDLRFPCLEDIHLGCEYTLAGKKYRSPLLNWQPRGFQRSMLRSPEHGEMECLTWHLVEDENHIGLALTFAITSEHPLVLWKMKVTNHGGQAVAMKRITMLNVDGRREGNPRQLRIGKPADLGFFSNGWQSWSPSRWYRGDSRMNISRLGFLQHPMIYNPDTPHPRRKGVFSSDMFAVIGDQVARTGYLVGFLSQKNHFGSILADLNTGSLSMWAYGDDARIEPGMSMETDWAVFTPVLLDHRAPMEVYLEAVARENHARVAHESPLGWCSWYHYYTNVTAEDVEKNLTTILDLQERLPIQIVQLDDGFESIVGDWFTFKTSFPDGVASLADRISREGLVPGIWLAPFIVNPRSQLMKQHPEWILSKQLGRPVNAGYGWNVLTTGLDMTVPEALNYVCDVIETAVKKWGFQYLKLDFYYAAGLKGIFHDRTKTRARVLRMGMEAIRAAVGENVMLLGCGAPLGSMIGIVDLMRIGADVSGDWHPNFRGIKGLLKSEPSFPCARNSIRNILTRANMHGQWWINDPDCLLVRPDSNLTLDEVKTLATAIGMTGGAIMISDDLSILPSDRLRLAEILYPILPEQVRVLDWFDSETPAKMRLDVVNQTGEWHVLGGFNWSDQAADIRVRLNNYHLEEGEYIFREFWSGKTGIFDGQAGFEFLDVPPHGCVLLAARRLVPGKPQYVGSDLHFSQGVEVAEWREDEGGVEMLLRLPRKASGTVFLRLPFKPSEVFVNGELVAPLLDTEETFSLPVQVDGFCTLQIKK